MIKTISDARYQLGFTYGIELNMRAVIWYQGEYDATASFAPLYQANEVILFNTMRNGIDIIGSENMKAIVPPVNNSTYTTYYAQVNAAKDYNAGTLPNYSILPGWIAPHTVDGIHADSFAQQLTGNQAALLAGATTQV
jgi:hypothetical protein